MTILWFMDRLGLPGQYHRTWVRLLRDNHVPTDEMRIIQLHKMLAPRQLLTSLGSRKAPTWVLDEESRIVNAIDAAIAHTKARMVVLSSPESLACLGLAPEHATLHNLRGSVYWRSGIPHLVMLPMSAWFSMVTQKEIGGANYGFESKETFASARQQGAVHSSGSDSASPAGLRGPGNDSGPERTVRTESGHKAPAKLERRSNSDSAAGVPSQQNQRDGAESQQRSGSTVRPAQKGPAVLPSGTLGRWGHLLSPVPADVVHGEGSGVESAGQLDAHLQDPDSFGPGDAEDEGTSQGPGPSGIHDDLEGDESEDRDDGPGHDDRDGLDAGEGDVPEDGGDSDGGVSSSSDSDEEVDREEGEMDSFFYEPVLSPVGRFVLIADVQKMFRILRDGKDSSGPSRPIEVNWR